MVHSAQNYLSYPPGQNDQDRHIPKLNVQHPVVVVLLAENLSHQRIEARSGTGIRIVAHAHQHHEIPLRRATP